MEQQSNRRIRRQIARPGLRASVVADLNLAVCMGEGAGSEDVTAEHSAQIVQHRGVTLSPRQEKS